MINIFILEDALYANINPSASEEDGRHGNIYTVVRFKTNNKMKKKVLLSLLALVIIVGAFLTVVANENGKSIRTIDYLEKEIYTEITFLSEGETEWSEAKVGEETGVAYRAIITTSEIYNNLIIEKVTYGAEGGGKNIKSRRNVDLVEFWKTFGLSGEIAGVEFVKWLSPVSFELTVYGEGYIVHDIDKDTIKVSRK